MNLDYWLPVFIDNKHLSSLKTLHKLSRIQYQYSKNILNTFAKTQVEQFYKNK